MTDQQIKGQVSLFDQDSWCGKMFPEPCPQTKAKTSAVSSKKRQGSPKRVPLYLDLRGGGWHYAGAIMGDGWSIAWRIHDAQFWGVPQRRKRIALVADFGGGSAPEILFVRKGLSGDSEESGEKGETAAAHAQGGTRKAISFQERAGKPGGAKES